MPYNAVQPPLSSEPAPHFSIPGNAWNDVARTCRRVWVLREHGRHDEAELLRQGELAGQVAAARSPAESDADVAGRLEAIMTHEAERVASAAVLAELLLPILAQQLRAPAATVATASPVAIQALPKLDAPQAPAQRPAASIADFIDMMIAQENATDLSARAAQRRAS
uniref:hypothetical protein n=1 Tax=Horticoccus sp. 23ND18S-11 TaxID=3391832 RepID=UPI0039C967CA